MEPSEQSEYLTVTQKTEDKAIASQHGTLTLAADFAPSMAVDGSLTYPQVYGYVMVPQDGASDGVSFVPTAYQLSAEPDESSSGGFLLSAGQVLVAAAEIEHDHGQSSMDMRSVYREDEFASGADFIINSLPTAAHVHNEVQSTDPKQVFASLSARLSAALLSSIPGSQMAFLQHTADDCQVSLRCDRDDTTFVLDGSYSGIVRAHQQLSQLISHENDVTVADKTTATTNDATRREDKTTATTNDTTRREDKATSCSLLQPQYSRSGRLLKLRTMELDEEEEEEEEIKPQIEAVAAAPVRRHRGRPRKVLEKSPEQPLDIIEMAASVIVRADGAQWAEQGEDEVPRDEGGGDVGDVIDGLLANEQCEKGDSQELEVENDPKAEASVMLGRPRPDKDYERLLPFRYTCDYCSYRSKRRTHLQHHLATHSRTGGTLLRCTRCPFTATQPGHLRRHLVMHSANVISCEHCKYKTDSQALMSRHVRSRHERAVSTPLRAVLRCPQCDYCTDRPQRFARHARCHATPPGLEAPDPKGCYQCEQCEYRTSRKEHYVRHVADVHSQHRPFLCDHCGRRFKRQDALKQHRSLHQAVQSRPFACLECNKSFRSQAHLTEHATRHSDVRAFLCEICGASFKTKSVQRKHIRTIHANPRAFPCAHCTKRFNTKFALQRHVNMHDHASSSSATIAERQECVATPGGHGNVQIMLEEQVIADLHLVAGDQSGVPGLQQAPPPAVAMDTAPPPSIVYGEDPDASVTIGSVDLQAAYAQSADLNDATTPALLYLTNFQSY